MGRQGRRWYLALRSGAPAGRTGLEGEEQGALSRRVRQASSAPRSPVAACYRWSFAVRFAGRRRPGRSAPLSDAVARCYRVMGSTMERGRWLLPRSEFRERHRLGNNAVAACYRILFPSPSDPQLFERHRLGNNWSLPATGFLGTPATASRTHHQVPREIHHHRRRLPRMQPDRHRQRHDTVDATCTF